MPKKKPKEADESQIRKETQIKDLPCVLTTEELEEKSEKLTGLMIEIQQEQDALKIHSKEVNDGIKTKVATVKGLTNVVHDRAEMRKVTCEAVFDYAANNVTVTRSDTNEVIVDRDLEGLEKQMQLGIEDEGDTTPGAETETDQDPDDTGKVDCPDCEGYGTNGDGTTECENCDGSGKVDAPEPTEETE